MTDATERAEKAIHGYGLSEMASKAAVRALMINPDTLAGLALEAGGLEQVGQGHQNSVDQWVLHTNPSTLHMNDVPVYRRKEKTSGSA